MGKQNFSLLVYAVYFILFYFFHFFHKQTYVIFLVTFRKFTRVYTHAVKLYFCSHDEYFIKNFFPFQHFLIILFHLFLVLSLLFFFHVNFIYPKRIKFAASVCAHIAILKFAAETAVPNSYTPRAFSSHFLSLHLFYYYNNCYCCYYYYRCWPFFFYCLGGEKKWA